jgi:hypothetical protein
MMDPIGLALENFDVTGQWRIKDSGVRVDAIGDFYDGLKMNGVADLRHALLSRKESIIRNFTENLMSYALGRRIEYNDQPVIRTIVRNAEQHDNHFSEFALGIVRSAAFQSAPADSVAATFGARR